MGRHDRGGALRLTTATTVYDHRATAVAIGLVACVATIADARVKPSIDGTWSGTATARAGKPVGTVSAALTQSGRAVEGVLSVDAGAASGVFTVAGQTHGNTVVLGGKHDSMRLRWKARWDRKSQAWRGPMMERGGGAKTRAMLVLAHDAGGGGPTCGADYFASTVMPQVIDRICVQCHVPGGMAQAAAFRVTPGNPIATAKSAAGQIDPADPTHSKLVMKPRMELPHGGGKRIVPGSPEDQVLLHWIALVTAPGCDLNIGPHGGGTGADLYAENCASCHGPDARGLDGRPDIHCSRDVTDAVRKGRSGRAGDMQAFTNLSDADIAKIQGFLDGLCPVAGVTGAELWASNCATCHGAGATGTDKGPNVRCATRAPDAMRVGRGARMPSFPSLTDPEVALVDGFLAGSCDQSGRVGADLYAGNCSSCHGATARGGVSGLGVEGPDVRCNRGIHDAVVVGRTAASGAMPAFTMPDAGIARVQAFLVGLCPIGSVTGEDLFASNCTTCHGPAGIGTATALRVRCATRIADAMHVGRGTRMPSFPGVVASEVSSIQGYLTTLCNQLGRTGYDLYAGNCTSCHGDDANGGVNGLGVTGPEIQCSEAGDYTEKIRFGSDAMPAFPAIGTGDVTAIVDYVRGTFCQGG